MTAPTRTQASGAMPVLPWVITGVMGVAFAIVGAAQVAARAAAAPGHVIPAYGDVAITAKRHGLVGLIGAGGSPGVFWALLVAQLFVLVAAAIGVALLARRHRPADGRRAMQSARAVRDLQHKAMAARARTLRPSLAKARDMAVADVGAVLGDVGGALVLKSHEDVELVICGPRSGKTSAKVVPEILAAPGPVIVTSNKPDVWTITAGMRAAVGPVWLFDPTGVTYQPQAFWWNPLRCVVDVESAARMAGYFMREVGGGASSGAGGRDRADPFFTPAAAKTLRQLLLAAASSGRTLRDVLEWVATRADEPAVLLERAGYPGQGVALRSTLELPPETKGGIFEGVATALACLESESLLRWLTPPATWAEPPRGPVPELDLWQLITAPGEPQPTVYLLSREGEGSGRPVVAAVVGELIDVAVRAASARGGRLDPPITVQLDEAANIVRLPELPAWMSWFGSMGLMVTVVLQSREQGRSVWGRDGFEALWSAATIKTVGAGVQDADFTEDLSRLIGDHKIEETSTSSSTGGHSTSRSLRTERILTAADIAALPRDRALLFTSGRRPAMLTLLPWYAEHDDRDLITRHTDDAVRQVQQAAIAHLGPGNPVAATLTAATAPRPSDHLSREPAPPARRERTS